MDNLNNPTPSLEPERDREASSEDRLPDVSPEDIANILDRVAQLSAERQRKRHELALQQTPQNQSQRVTISVTNTDEHELIPQVLNIIVRVPSLYQQHGGVILRHRDNGKGKIEVLGEKALRREIMAFSMVIATPAFLSFESFVASRTLRSSPQMERSSPNPGITKRRERSSVCRQTWKVCRISLPSPRRSKSN